MVTAICSILKSIADGLVKRLRAMRYFNTTFRSGTSEYSTPLDVFDAAVMDLVKRGRLGDKVCFKSKEAKVGGRCEVAWHDNSLFGLSWEPREVLITCSFVYKGSLEIVLKERGVKLPESWKLDCFKSGKWVRFRVPKEATDTVGVFLDLLFRRIYGCPKNYKVYGSIPLDYDNYV